MDFLSEVFGITLKLSGAVLAAIGLVIILMVVIVALAFDMLFHLMDGGR